MTEETCEHCGKLILFRKPFFMTGYWYHESGYTECVVTTHATPKRRF